MKDGKVLSFKVKKRQKGADGVNMELKHREAETETPGRRLQQRTRAQIQHITKLHLSIE